MDVDVWVNSYDIRTTLGSRLPWQTEMEHRKGKSQEKAGTLKRGWILKALFEKRGNWIGSSRQRSYERSSQFLWNSRFSFHSFSSMHILGCYFHGKRSPSAYSYYLPQRSRRGDS